VAASLGRRTRRVAELARLVGHTSGGRPAERLSNRLGLPQSDDTVLRNLKRHAGSSSQNGIRVVGVDDWAWQRGCRYGTIMVDLERREVVDVLPDRSAKAIGEWLAQHPGIEIVGRHRCGLYVEPRVMLTPTHSATLDAFKAS
jgi:transposase